MTFSWQMIGGFGHLRHFRLGLPIRLPVLFTFTARFLSTEQFVFIKKTQWGFLKMFDELLSDSPIPS